LTLSFDSLSGSAVDWSNRFWNNDISGVDGWKIFGVAGAVTGLEHLALGSPADWSDSTRTPLATARPGAGFHLVLEEDGVYLNYQAAAVPEPSLFFYLSLVLFGGAMRRRRGPSGRHAGATIEGARS
jgi:hypothetical protein